MGDLPETKPCDVLFPWVQPGALGQTLVLRAIAK